MKRIIILMILILPLTSIARTWATQEDRLKSCMSNIYSAQSTFHLEHHNFAKNLEDLKLSRDKACDNIKIKFTKLSSNAFEAKASMKNSIWTIDSDKVMKKIQ
jgi:type II secretory pathway pseudopilin PulG